MRVLQVRVAFVEPVLEPVALERLALRAVLLGDRHAPEAPFSSMPYS